MQSSRQVSALRAQSTLSSDHYQRVQSVWDREERLQPADWMCLLLCCLGVEGSVRLLWTLEQHLVMFKSQICAYNRCLQPSRVLELLVRARCHGSHHRSHRLSFPRTTFVLRLTCAIAFAHACNCAECLSFLNHSRRCGVHHPFGALVSLGAWSSASGGCFTSFFRADLRFCCMQLVVAIVPCPLREPCCHV